MTGAKRPTKKTSKAKKRGARDVPMPPDGQYRITKKGLEALAPVGDPLDLLCEAITAEWESDAWAPGVVVSYVSKAKDPAGRWYASIVRYPHGGNGSRVVQKKAYGATRADAIAKLAVDYLGKIETRARLARALEGWGRP